MSYFGSTLFLFFAANSSLRVQPFNKALHCFLEVSSLHSFVSTVQYSLIINKRVLHVVILSPFGAK